uniref:Uncharacterized protein n=1 Tax=Amphilophus citrinellus TaxID=61819 RepID=A0A3Q0S605_AMPCI
SPGVCSLGWTSSRLTSMCSRVKITGSLMNTRLDSLLIEAAMMSELTWAEALLQYLHVCPACPFSLLKLFYLRRKRTDTK